jgi:protein phosphatase
MTDNLTPSEATTGPLVLDIPEKSLVLLIGVSGSGKSTFGRAHFGTYEVISSDFARGLVSDDENDQASTKDAFDVLRYIAGKRLAAGRLTVIDATNVQPEARRTLVALAKEHNVLPVAIVLDLPEAVCGRRNADRRDRDFGPQVIKRQHDQLKRSLRGLGKEGFRKVHVLRSEDDIERATVVRTKLLNDHRDLHGPFDVIGDVHGCRSELETLLQQLGYVIERDEQGRPIDAMHPEGRQVIFLGDLVDRGPDSPGVLRLAMGMVGNSHARAVPGNHESKLVSALQGRKVTISHGLAETLEQLASEPPEFRAEVEKFCYDLVAHQVLDDGKLVVAHAGLKESYQGRASGRVRAFALYGDTTGETDEYGLPVRFPWATEYRGQAMVLYGHTPTTEATWINNTMCLDTGCVFGGCLTALRYPEKELVSVPAEQVWYEPVRPLGPSASDSGHREPDALNITDVLGKRVVDTAHHGRITIREESAAGALEVMSRFAIDPRWLLYLPPTMSPCNTSQLDGVLEHPAEAFAGFKNEGIAHVICEEKHMGSRAVVLVCRDDEVAKRRFGTDGGAGAVYTRTGRAFFKGDLTAQFLSKVRAVIDTVDLWKQLDTDWILLDAELLPWSAKADDLLRNQYAAVGAAARAALPAAVHALALGEARGLDLTDLLGRTTNRAANASAFTDAYRRYVWPTDGLAGVQLAPFQVLASEGTTYHDRPHDWHLAVIDQLVDADPEFFRRTRRQLVDVTDETSVAAGTEWWEALTGAGGEGMVVKPLANLVRARKGLSQPGVKVRGREYLRIIYGPDYTEPANLARLRDRNLGHKRSMALREYALGLESLERVARGEPMWRIHEAVFAVLAMESEPVDPRL